VDQDHAVSADCIEAIADAVAALGPADDERPQVQLAKGSRRKLFLPGSDHNADLIDTSMGNEALRRVPKNWLAGQRTILLGQSAAQALAFSSCDDQGGHLHRARLAPEMRLL
jgi:streptogramin lyase